MGEMADYYYEDPLPEQTNKMTELEEANHRIGLLAEALRDVLIKAGVLREDRQQYTGLELLTAADTYIDGCR